MRLRRYPVWAVALLALAGTAATACGPARPSSLTAAPADIQPAAGYQAQVFADNLNGPTQMILGPGGEVWVAELNGEEDAGMGRVVVLPSAGAGERRVVLQGLFKPTGIAIVSGALWIASGRDILRAVLQDRGVGEPETVLAELPYNRRSNGTLTPTPDGRLLFETSGHRIGSEAEAGSAQLWELDPASPNQPRVVAVGLKNAYGHAFDSAGRLWATDVADDPVNGGPPPDELNLIRDGADYGWPRCFGDRQPADNYAGTVAGCQSTQAATAVFPGHSTPTSVVASPWQADALLVALWGPTDPAVVRVTYSVTDAGASLQEVAPFLTGLAHPQHLLTLPDGSLLVSDHETGIIYRIVKGQ